MEILPYEEEYSGMSLNKGSQTEAFLCESDIVIYVGVRGSGKTHLMLAKNLPHIHKPHYRSIYFRKMVRDSQTAGGIADRSNDFFKQFGKYRSSLQLMTWDFESGAKTVFANYSAPESDFAEAVQGIEYHAAYIDEITQITEERFNAIFSNLRNTDNEKTQIFGTCNADPDSWILRLISRYIDPDTGYHIPEMNGVETYFYQWGNDISEAYWGNTKEEVLELAEPYIDEVWTDEMARYGSKLDLIQSLTVFESKMEENIHIMRSGGVKYFGKLLKGSLEMRSRYARACWKRMELGDSLISTEDLERMYQTARQTTGKKYASMDVAGGGRDNAVIWIWDGMHITNVYSTKGKTAKALLDWTARILSREEVPQENFVYDRVGVGFAFTGFYDLATPFVSNAAPSEESMVEFEKRKLNVYANAKAEAVGRFVDTLVNKDNTGECGVSIDETVLNKVINGTTVRDILNEEKNVIRWRSDREGKYQIIDRKETKRILGRSPDYILAMIYRIVLENKKAPITRKKAQGIVNRLAGSFLKYY